MLCGSKIAMAGSEKHPGRITACGLLAIVLSLGALGCAGAPEPVSQAPRREQAPAQTPAPDSPKKPPTSKASTAREIPPAGSGPKREDDPNVVVVDPGDEGNGSISLAEAARAERERRARAGRPVASITDKNLPEYARKGQITVMDGKEEKKAAGGAVTPAPPATEPMRDEQYWRNRALEIRTRWREVADEIQELEQNAGKLRQRFYGEEDPYVRDTQIKPEWDRVLDRLRQARVEVETARRELAEFLEEGRTSGALDGWLREGIDLEPEEEEPAKKTPPAQSIEPPVVEPPAAGEEGA
jgi:hypothetical protein